MFSTLLSAAKGDDDSVVLWFRRHGGPADAVSVRVTDIPYSVFITTTLEDADLPAAGTPASEDVWSTLRSSHLVERLGGVTSATWTSVSIVGRGNNCAALQLTVMDARAVMASAEIIEELEMCVSRLFRPILGGTPQLCLRGDRVSAFLVLTGLRPLFSCAWITHPATTYAAFVADQTMHGKCNSLHEFRLTHLSFVDTKTVAEVWAQDGICRFPCNNLEECGAGGGTVSETPRRVVATTADNGRLGSVIARAVCEFDADIVFGLDLAKRIAHNKQKDCSGDFGRRGRAREPLDYSRNLPTGACGRAYEDSSRYAECLLGKKAMRMSLGGCEAMLPAPFHTPATAVRAMCDPGGGFVSYARTFFEIVHGCGQTLAFLAEFKASMLTNSIIATSNIVTSVGAVHRASKHQLQHTSASDTSGWDGEVSGGYLLDAPVGRIGENPSNATEPGNYVLFEVDYSAFYPSIVENSNMATDVAISCNRLAMQQHRDQDMNCDDDDDDVCMFSAWDIKTDPRRRWVPQEQAWSLKCRPPDALGMCGANLYIPRNGTLSAVVHMSIQLAVIIKRAEECGDAERRAVAKLIRNILVFGMQASVNGLFTNRSLMDHVVHEGVMCVRRFLTGIREGAPNMRPVAWMTDGGLVGGRLPERGELSTVDGFVKRIIDFSKEDAQKACNEMVVQERIIAGLRGVPIDLVYKCQIKHALVLPGRGYLKYPNDPRGGACSVPVEVREPYAMQVMSFAMRIAVYSAGYVLVHSPVGQARKALNHVIDSLQKLVIGAGGAFGHPLAFARTYTAGEVCVGLKLFDMRSGTCGGGTAPKGNTYPASCVINLADVRADNMFTSRPRHDQSIKWDGTEYGKRKRKGAGSSLLVVHDPSDALPASVLWDEPMPCTVHMTNEINACIEEGRIDVDRVHYARVAIRDFLNTMLYEVACKIDRIEDHDEAAHASAHTHVTAAERYCAMNSAAAERQRRQWAATADKIVSGVEGLEAIQAAAETMYPPGLLYTKVE